MRLWCVYDEDFDGSAVEFNRKQKFHFQLYIICVFAFSFSKPFEEIKTHQSKVLTVRMQTICEVDYIYSRFLWNGSPLFCSERQSEKKRKSTIVCSNRTVDNNAFNVNYFALSYRFVRVRLIC